MEFQITDREDRKMTVSVGADDSLMIVKHYKNEGGSWLSREMIINADEWALIEQSRRKILGQ